MSFSIFRILFHTPTIVTLHATKNNSVILNVYNSSSIEQLDVCEVIMGHKDKDEKCRFF